VGGREGGLCTTEKFADAVQNNIFLIIAKTIDSVVRDSVVPN